MSNSEDAEISLSSNLPSDTPNDNGHSEMQERGQVVE